MTRAIFSACAGSNCFGVRAVTASATIAPNGLITETFAELDRMNEELGYFEPRPWHRDNPQRPKVWEKDPSASNLWGIMPPDEMMQ
jgi:hypothetical protein